MAEVPARLAPPAQRALPPGAPPLPAFVPAASAPPPGLSNWLKLLGVFAILLLGFVSLKTCSALVQAVAGGQ